MSNSSICWISVENSSISYGEMPHEVDMTAYDVSLRFKDVKKIMKKNYQKILNFEKI